MEGRTVSPGRSSVPVHRIRPYGPRETNTKLGLGSEPAVDNHREHAPFLLDKGGLWWFFCPG